MSFQFSPAQKEQFQRDGFLAVEGFWNEQEVAAMRAELERFKALGLLRNVATDGDGQTRSAQKANLQLCPMSPHSRLFRAMPFAPKAIAAVEQLLGGPLRLRLDQVFLKPGGSGAGTNWHQDNSYFGLADTRNGVALWTAVHDATRENGTMRVIPAAFETPLEHSRDPESNHHLRCFPDEEQAVTIELKAGGALFFLYGTPHATGGNATAHERAGVALHFFNAHASGESGGDLIPFPFLTGPNASGGQREYGERVAGTWEQEVEAALNVTSSESA